MELKTLITIFVVCGLVFGGLIFFLVKALKFERDKK